MKILNIAIYPHLTKRKELQGACHMISSQTLEKTGCLDCRVFTGEGEESAIHIEQRWPKRQLLEDYFRSNHFSALLGAMKLLAKKYELTINDGSPEETMILINWVREK